MPHFLGKTIITTLAFGPLGIFIRFPTNCGSHQKDMSSWHCQEKMCLRVLFLGKGACLPLSWYHKKYFPTHPTPISASWVVWVLFSIFQLLWLMGYVKHEFLHGVFLGNGVPTKEIAAKRMKCGHLPVESTWKPTALRLVWKEGTVSHVAPRNQRISSRPSKGTDQTVVAE